MLQEIVGFYKYFNVIPGSEALRPAQGRTGRVAGNFSMRFAKGSKPTRMTHYIQIPQYSDTMHKTVKDRFCKM